MTLSNALFVAILAMDSYNRGYDAGLSGLGGEGFGICAATIAKDAEQLLNAGGAEAAGFYAVASQWNGETVISYRGTDNANPLAEGSNSWNGWTPGGGDFGSAVVIPGPRPGQA
ncbi:hypothetical protein [Hoeflea sp.]|uniref:hypothetical protein n=1 Tax=Hoeflea sp. TaxID=1940281 RepID=UPI003A9229FF